MCQATCLYYIVDHFGPGPGIEGTRTKGQSTCETKWIQQRTEEIRSDTRVSTGGKEMHWMCAAATCVDQVPTSRRTVSCTEALQVHTVLFFSIALLSPSKRHVFELATLFVQEIVMH